MIHGFSISLYLQLISGGILNIFHKYFFIPNLLLGVIYLFTKSNMIFYLLLISIAISFMVGFMKCVVSTWNKIKIFRIMTTK